MVLQGPYSGADYTKQGTCIEKWLQRCLIIDIYSIKVLMEVLTLHNNEHAHDLDISYYRYLQKRVLIEVLTVQKSKHVQKKSIGFIIYKISLV